MVRVKEIVASMDFQEFEELVRKYPDLLATAEHTSFADKAKEQQKILDTELLDHKIHFLYAFTIKLSPEELAEWKAKLAS